MIIWPAYTNIISAYLNDNRSEKQLTDTAEFIALQYESAVRTGTTIFQNIVLSTPGYQSIQSGFVVAFQQMQINNNILPSYFAPAASAIIAFWQSVLFNPLPPAPGTTAPSPGVQIIFPGDTASLQAGLFNAFNTVPATQPLGAAVAGKLSSAFSSHVATIAGIYIGLSVAPPFAPIAVPWVGII